MDMERSANFQLFSDSFPQCYKLFVHIGEELMFLLKASEKDSLQHILFTIPVTRLLSTSMSLGDSPEIGAAVLSTSGV